MRFRAAQLCEGRRVMSRRRTLLPRNKAPRRREEQVIPAMVRQKGPNRAGPKRGRLQRVGAATGAGLRGLNWLEIIRST